MDSFQNTDLNPTRPVLEPLESAIYPDKINFLLGEGIDVNSYIIYPARKFEDEPVNELSYHFGQGYTSTDI